MEPIRFQDNGLVKVRQGTTRQSDRWCIQVYFESQAKCYNDSLRLIWLTTFKERMVTFGVEIVVKMHLQQVYCV